MTALDTRALHKGAAPFVRGRKEVRSYRGLPIQAAPGVHEFVAGYLEVNRPHESPVLEVGAGSGALTARLMDRNFEVVPVDMKAAPFTRCCPRFVEADLNSTDWVTSLPATVYDTIVAVGIIERLESPKRFIRNLHTLCSPGGEALVTTPNIMTAGSLFDFIRRGTFHGFSPESYETAGRMSILPYWLIESFAYDAGFAEAETMLIGERGHKFLKQRLLRIADRALRRRRGEREPVNGSGNVVLVRMVKAE